MYFASKEHVEVIRQEVVRIYSRGRTLGDLSCNAACLCAIIMPRGLRPFKLFV